ncbi:hypothetical protein [Burkholderia sp. Bp9143]|uniref:hypothetical protein n=1 Tax=Burkholderia sp. Bp9143 TaxID=2184574 RepID=UPI001626EDC9|nr:hypothetical protein [Burkholderia sp. Bp9143]
MSLIRMFSIDSDPFLQTYEPAFFTSFIPRCSIDTEFTLPDGGSVTSRTVRGALSTTS